MRARDSRQRLLADHAHARLRQLGRDGAASAPVRVAGPHKELSQADCLARAIEHGADRLAPAAAVAAKVNSEAGAMRARRI